VYLTDQLFNLSVKYPTRGIMASPACRGYGPPPPVWGVRVICLNQHRRHHT
jgi:hypothetical protein